LSSPRDSLKNLAKRFLVKSRAMRVAMKFKARRAVILTYHSVRQDLEPDADWVGPGITHSAEIFRRQMELIAARFNPVTLDDILLFLKNEKELPGYPVVVTFDDGFLDNVEVAAPVLRQYGIRAAFYVTVGLIGSTEAPWYSRVRRAMLTTKRDSWNSSLYGREWDLQSPAARDKALVAAYEACAPLVKEEQREAIDTIQRELDVAPDLPPRRMMMNWEETKSLRRGGHIVGSHTVTHPNVAYIKDGNDLRSELVESKRMIEEQLGEMAGHFSYPHPALTPQWNEKTLVATRDAGYVSAVTTTKGPVQRGANPLALKRINAPRAEHEFLWNLERAFLKA
jgi:peptidoglycan/xylan/chitin deacetylase (PgdA/CDA1 family)